MKTYTEALGEYARLKLQEREIAEKIKELNPVIQDGMIHLGLDKQPTNLGDFIIIKRKYWKYSETCEAMRQGLKDKEADEEARGIATFTEKPQLQFREKKNEPTE